MIIPVVLPHIRVSQEYYISLKVESKSLSNLIHNLHIISLFFTHKGIITVLYLQIFIQIQFYNETHYAFIKLFLLYVLPN